MGSRVEVVSDAALLDAFREEPQPSSTHGPGVLRTAAGSAGICHHVPVSGEGV